MRKLPMAVAAMAVLLVGCSSPESTADRATPQVSSTTFVSTSPATSSASATPSASTPEESTTSATTTTTPVPGTVIKIADSEFGGILFDDTGQAIYLFDTEVTAEPACYDECAVAWPPVLTVGPPVAGEGVDAGLLSTTLRTDGSVQVTYAGHPLYYYAHEGKNEVLCHNVREFGGLWLALSASGEPAPH